MLKFSAFEGRKHFYSSCVKILEIADDQIYANSIRKRIENSGHKRASSTSTTDETQKLMRVLSVASY